MGDVLTLRDYRLRILDRKATIRALLQEWDNHDICDCDTHPDCPRCILQTEFDLLTKYVHILDRELWYIGHEKERRTNT